MIKKLLVLFVLVSSLHAYSQATATTPPNLQSCTDIFNLSTQDTFILGTQNPSIFTVSYYNSEADAQNGLNPIPNSLAFTGFDMEIVYARVDSSLDDTFATVSFELDIVAVPATPIVSDVSVCDSYVLPALPAGQSYWTGPNGSGTPMFLGDIITITMEVHVLADNGICSSSAGFVVTISATPPTPQVSDVFTCNYYFLPSLPPGHSYHYASGGNTPVTDLMIGYNGTIWVFAQLGNNPNCYSEASFTVYTLPTVNGWNDVVACDQNDDGFEAFDLDAVATQMSLGDANAVIKFFETEIDAYSGSNELSSPYYNMMPNNQTIYVSYSNSFGCSSVFSIQLVAQPCTNNTLSGIVRVDSDSNGCSASDSTLSSTGVTCVNDGISNYTATNNVGVYTFTNVQLGNNTVAIHLPELWTEPAPQTFNYSGTNETYTANFCVVPPVGVNDASISIIPITAARPGFQATYVLRIWNYGSTPISGNAVFNFEDLRLEYDFSMPAQISQTSSSATFGFSNLAPLSYTIFYITMLVSTPPVANGGDVLEFSANLTTNETDINPENNLAALSQTIVNSFDPNDITCHEGDFIAEDEAGDFLHYTIRFQNTGTAEAVNIRLENVLDPLLDWSTFEPMVSSHTYQASRNAGNLTFNFNNIMLPASTVNEPGSHGFMTYRIRPLPGLQIGEVISNTADIFFDFNAPITTNTATTQIQQLSVNENDRNAFVIYPNPASDSFNINLFNAVIDNISIVDLQEKVVLSIPNNTASVDISGIASGLYFVRIVAGEKTEVRKLVVE